MKIRNFYSLILATILSMASVGICHAAAVAYSDQASFFSALPGGSQTLDFESLSSGTLIPSASVVGGTTFTYSISGLDMIVASDFDTTSGSNSLGLNDAGNFNQFVAGDEFDLSFSSPVNALGIFFITGDPTFAGDIQLITGVGTALNSAVEELTLADGGLAYFLGLTSDSSFSSAMIRFDPLSIGAILYNVDDITTATVSAVPVPGTLLLFISGLLGSAFVSNSSRCQGCRDKRKGSAETVNI